MTRLTLAATLLVAGCGSATVYYADGVDLVTRDADVSICEAQALSEFPTRDVTRFTAPVFHPPIQSCDAAGNCVTQPGFWRSGRPYTTDANLEPRAVATRGCMGTRGYARITLPSCGADTMVQYSTVMPSLTESTCILYQRGSESLIVNPEEG
jgi:hypothetical protein